jgi:hypothetical protein
VASFDQFGPIEQTLVFIRFSLDVRGSRFECENWVKTEGVGIAFEPMNRWVKPWLCG